MNYEKIIEELGFVFKDAEIIQPQGTEFDDQEVRTFENLDTKHHILIWPRDQFSCENLQTSERTHIIDFNNVMKFYFETITKL